LRRLAYISFDQVPAAKGASTHIEAFVRGLAGAFGGVDLVTVSTSAQVEGPRERWPGVMHWELPALGSSLIERVLHFGGLLKSWLEAREYDVIHFRSNFEGMPILKGRKSAALVFEVNGLPSIELKYRYPGSEDDSELMGKLQAQERACLAGAQLIVTPSGVTRDYLVGTRGAAPGKVAVIPNGADTELFCPSRLQPARGDYRLLYFGTLASWQGVEVAVRAVAVVAGAMLRVIGTGTSGRKNALVRLAAKLGAADRISIEGSVPQGELAAALAGCDAVLAPLLWNDRNVLQGCCPLKVLEGMAAGRPVIASNMRVVRELGADGEHLLLTEPGSVDSMAAAIVRLRGDAGLASKVAGNARRLVEERYTWAHAVDSLTDAYRHFIFQEELQVSSSDEFAPVLS
jgi:glycosyltransferase involved in cell wall biosynthesis